MSYTIITLIHKVQWALVCPLSFWYLSALECIEDECAATNSVCCSEGLCQWKQRLRLHRALLCHPGPAWRVFVQSLLHFITTSCIVLWLYLFMFHFLKWKWINITCIHMCSYLKIKLVIFCICSLSQKFFLYLMRFKHVTLIIIVDRILIFLTIYIWV